MLNVEKTTVLIVDDDETQREYIASKFDPARFEILQAPTGRAALDKVRGREVQVVISDYLMPDAAGSESGIDLLRTIGSRQATPPVTVLTTGFSDLLPENTFSQGINAIFCKPFDPLELVATVRKKLGI